jgi:uncharacterized protein GlcG (DUF336 family)
MTTLTLEQASTIIDTALAHGRRTELKPLCVVVLDAGGHVLALRRDERASFSRPQIATAKAAGCLDLGFGGRETARRAQERPVSPAIARKMTKAVPSPASRRPDSWPTPARRPANAATPGLRSTQKITRDRL